MNLCGVSYPVAAPLWWPIAFATLVYLLPIILPWHRARVAVFVPVAVIVTLFVLSAFLDQAEDICDPPYFKMQMKIMASGGAWAAAVAGFVVFVCSRHWRAAFLLYPVSIMPAIAAHLIIL